MLSAIGKIAGRVQLQFGSKVASDTNDLRGSIVRRPITECDIVTAADVWNRLWNVAYCKQYQQQQQQLDEITVVALLPSVAGCIRLVQNSLK